MTREPYMPPRRETMMPDSAGAMRPAGAVALRQPEPVGRAIRACRTCGAIEFEPTESDIAVRCRRCGGLEVVQGRFAAVQHEVA
jgi:DNA-directed RNA polymerase subunit RPC12/RpoP